MVETIPCILLLFGKTLIDFSVSEFLTKCYVLYKGLGPDTPLPLPSVRY